MAYRIQLTGTADKFLTKLARSQPKQAAAIENAIESLVENPCPTGCKPLKGLPGIWRVRVGNYRICYTIDDGKLVVLVVAVSTRDDVDELLRRYLGR